ncbi:MAG: LppX_LprAFG lipoprotein [Ktedonobacteraceae bacterium]|nr:LppX_LprAFG lipoprotein [Ktedonobacteraceae bacterium]
MLRTLTIKRVLVSIVLSLLCLLLITSCALPTLPWKQGKGGKAGSRPTTQQLLTALQKNFAAVKSFHVVMQVQNAGPAAPGQVQISSASGDVVMPDKVKAQATVVLSGQSVAVNLISVGDQQFITDPITGQWRVIKGVLDPRTLTNPQTGIISLIGKVQNVSQPVADSVNGTACWRVKGQLDAKHLAFLTGGGAPAGTMLQTSACLGRTNALPYQVSIVGPAAPGDTAQTSRIFTLSRYNQNVQISAPQV